MQMKMFVHSALDAVELEVNQWMAAHPHFSIVQAVQSQSEKQGRFVFVISIFYR